MKPGFEDWLNMKCYHNSDITNQEFVDVFVRKYFKWISRQKKIVGCETRELKLKEFPGVHKQKIQRMIYSMSA